MGKQGKRLARDAAGPGRQQAAGSGHCQLAAGVAPSLPVAPAWTSEVGPRRGGGARAPGPWGLDWEGQRAGVQTHSLRGLCVCQAEPRLRSQNIGFWVCPQDPCRLPALCPPREGLPSIRASLDTPCTKPFPAAEPVLTPPGPRPQLGSRSEVKLPGQALRPALDPRKHPGSCGRRCSSWGAWACSGSEPGGVSSQRGRQPWLLLEGLRGQKPGGPRRLEAV